MERTLFHLSGAAAIAGGALRIANTLTLHVLDPHTLDLGYLLTDLFLLLGLTGWYAAHAGKLGASGIAGFAIAVAGILVIRSAALFPGYGYQAGAMALLAGLVVMNLTALVPMARARLAAWLWLAAFGCAMASLVAPALAIVSAVLFGAGFICAGIGLLRS